VDRNPWVPTDRKPTHNARQRQFLLLADVPEVFYGGAAGGGKTIAILIAAAQFVHVPGYSALLLRENWGDLNQPCSWIPESKEWWLNTSARWSASECRWYFPSGATITFGYMERDDDVYQYDTAAYQFVGVDELTQHTEWRYRFLFGRIRRPLHGPLSEVPLRMRAASNPGNKGHEWVKSRFIKKETRERDAAFVPARLDDNVGNMDVETYRRDQLSKLDPLTRAQREKGDWDAVKGGRFLAEWFANRWRPHGTGFALDERIVPRELVEVFGAVDPAASAKETCKTEDPDYTVISVWGRTPLNELLWLDCVRFRKEVPDIVPEIERVYQFWGLSFVAIEIVAANQAVYQIAKRSRMVVRTLSPGGQDKLVRATPATILAQSRRIWLPDWAPWIVDALGELLRFTGNEDEDAHDDVVDTVAYAARLLTEKTDQRAGFRPYVVGGG
jgi:predicted phage terminase large subunit-like protein